MQTPVALPLSLEQAVNALADRPDAMLLAGGTDAMVQINFALSRPTRIVALRRVPELRGWQETRDTIDLGAMLTYQEVQAELASRLPALAMASRTVGSPPIRNRGTIGGNVVTASPAGDLLPVLLALDASVELHSATERRTLRIWEFLLGPKQNARRHDEVLTRIRVPKVLGPQQFLKVGPRNAMVISVASLALVLDVKRRQARCALGSVGPTALRATRAEQFLSERLDWSTLRISHQDADEFARVTSHDAAPITDKRGTSDYRRHCVQVLARRALQRSAAVES
jgi:CO/xanthine dehydrogenase FAD-binding subunit